MKIICEVLKYSWKHKIPELRSALTYWENDIPSRIDLGKDKYGGPFTYEDEIHVLKEHYQKLGKEKNVESFENEWKIHVQSRIREYERLSVDITNEHLDRDISAIDIEYVMKSLRNRKASGSDGIAGELIKYGGNGMIMMLKELFQLIWDSEYIPERWGEGMIISLFKKGDREDPGNFRGITLLNVVGKLFNKVLNYRLLQWLEEHNKLSES